MEQPGRALPKLPRAGDGKRKLCARYTPGEVLRYKLDWEKHCAEAAEDDIDSPVDEIHETPVIEGGSHEIYLSLANSKLRRNPRGFDLC